MTDDIATLARRLERIEDELTQVEGMDGFRERISQIRMDLVDLGLENGQENMTVIDEYGGLKERFADTDLIVPVMQSTENTRNFTCGWCENKIDGDAMVPEKANQPMHTACWREWLDEQ